MLRSLLTSVLAAVVTGMLVWGGCVSCQNLFSQKQTTNGCCETAGKCKTPAPEQSGHKHCKSAALALDQYVKADPDRVLQGWAAPEPVVTEALWTPAAAPLARESAYSPPEIFLLNSAFRI